MMLAALDSASVLDGVKRRAQYYGVLLNWSVEQIYHGVLPMSPVEYRDPGCYLCSSIELVTQQPQTVTMQQHTRSSTDWHHAGQYTFVCRSTKSEDDRSEAYLSLDPSQVSNRQSRTRTLNRELFKTVPGMSTELLHSTP
jgi:hypothetical protein